MARTKSRTETQQERKADRTIVTNRRAFHEYFVLESLEVGIVLFGTEIKSLREGKVQMGEAYARIENGELWLIGMHISPYSHGSHSNHQPDRPRKLMAHKAQIANMRASVEQRGLTLVPLKLYLKGGKAKVELGLCRGKKLYDKRQTAAERESERDIQRALRDRG